MRAKNPILRPASLSLPSSSTFYICIFIHFPILLWFQRCSLHLPSPPPRSVPTGWTARFSRRPQLLIYLTSPTPAVKISERPAYTIPSSRWAAKDTIVVLKLLSRNKLCVPPPLTHSPPVSQNLNHQAANKDPRWNDAGIGLGLGLSGVTTRCGVVQSKYVLSRPPLFLETLRPTERKSTEKKSVIETDEKPAPALVAAGSLWNAVTEFLDLLAPPNSPIIEKTVSESPAALAVLPSIHVSAIHAISSPARIIALAPIELTPPTRASPVPQPSCADVESPASPPHALPPSPPLQTPEFTLPPLQPHFKFNWQRPESKRHLS